LRSGSESLAGTECASKGRNCTERRKEIFGERVEQRAREILVELRRAWRIAGC